MSGATAVVTAALWLRGGLVLVVAVLLYGVACGHLYCIALDAVRRSAISRLGLATGCVVACFAAGSAFWSLAFGWAVGRYGPQEALWILAAAFLVAGVAGSFLVPKVARERRSAADHLGSAARPSVPQNQPEFVFLWLGFFAVSAAGLGVISQAAFLPKVIQTVGPATLTALVAVGNGLGRVAGGALVDSLPSRLVAAMIGTAAAAGLAVSVVSEGWVFAAAVVLVAVSYGAASGAYPGILMRLSSGESFPKAFARLFTSWGIASGIAPTAVAVLASHLGSYCVPFVAIAALNLLAGALLLGRLVRGSASCVRQIVQKG
jgi:MFS family permease